MSMIVGIGFFAFGCFEVVFPDRVISRWRDSALRDINPLMRVLTGLRSGPIIVRVFGLIFIFAGVLLIDSAIGG